MVDDSAAIALTTDAPESWRTHHLRIRAAEFRDAGKAGALVVERCPGLVRVADLGSKAVGSEVLNRM